MTNHLLTPGLSRINFASWALHPGCLELQSEMHALGTITAIDGDTVTLNPSLTEFHQQVCRRVRLLRMPSVSVFHCRSSVAMRLAVGQMIRVFDPRPARFLIGGVMGKVRRRHLR